MSLTLAFDTSSDFCSAAFLLDGKVICECSKEFLRGHAEKLVPMIKNIGKESGLEISDVLGFFNIFGFGGREFGGFYYISFEKHVCKNMYIIDDL